MPAHKGTQPPGGSRKGRPNKITTEIKDAVIEALRRHKGADYLERQALENPVAFMTLLGKVLPLQVTGNDGGDLIIKIVKYNRSDADDNSPA